MTPTQSPTLASQATAELPKPADRAPRLHRLKTDPEVYQAVLAGHKTFEIRLNDRDFRIGDELLLMETTVTGEAIRAGAPLQFTGNEVRKRVSHVLSGYGLMPGWVCLSFDCYEAGRASRAQSEWLPIETAPKDGRTMFVVRCFDVTDLNCGARRYTTDPYCVWPGDEVGWVRWPHVLPPTHWMPLPATPGETK